MRLAHSLLPTLALLALPSLAAAQALAVPCAEITDRAECLNSCTPTDVLDNDCDCYWDAPPDIDPGSLSPTGFPQDATASCPPGVPCCWNAPCSKWFDPTECVVNSGGTPPDYSDSNCAFDIQTGCTCRPPLVPVDVQPGPGPVFATFDCQCPYLTKEEWAAQGGTGTCAPPALDHLTFYKVKTSKGADRFVRFGPLLLSDAFLADAPYQVTKPAQLGLPSDKNGEGVNDPDTHREEYLVKPMKGGPAFSGLSDVVVTNQCNELRIEVGKPWSLLVPTAKSLTDPVTAPDPVHHNLEHFLCYKAKPQAKLADGTRLPKFPKGIQVDVADQFQTRRYDLVKITKLCNSVDKAGTPTLLSGKSKGTPKPITPATRLDPDAHLLCYQARLATRMIDQMGCGGFVPGDRGTVIAPKQAKHAPLTGLYVANQFGAERLDTVKEAEFCIPSQIALP